MRTAAGSFLSLLLGLLVLSACTETPRCVENFAGETELQCNDRKTPACDGAPEDIYDVDSGGLIPVSTDRDTGSCDGFDAPCRPTPVCAEAGRTPECANGNAAICVFGTPSNAVPTAP